MWTDGLFIPTPGADSDPHWQRTVADLEHVLTHAWPDITWQVVAEAQPDGSTMVGAAREHGGRWWGFACHIKPCDDGCTLDHDQQPEFRAAVVRMVSRRMAIDITRMN